MPSIDTDKLTAILNAAQNPAFKKLLEDKGKAEKALDETRAHLADVEGKLFETIPPALKSMLQPPEAPKTRKPKATSGNGDLKKPDLQELKQILDRRLNNTLHIRKDGFDSKAIKILAEANPDLLAYETSTWPKVRYLR